MSERLIADQAAADGLAATDLYNQDGYKLAAFQSKQRTASIRAGYAAPEVIDAFLFLQGLLKPHRLPKLRTSQFLRAGLIMTLTKAPTKGRWKKMVDEVIDRLEKEREKEKLYWEGWISEMDSAAARDDQLDFLSRYLEALKANIFWLDKRRHDLRQQVMKFVLRAKKTSLGVVQLDESELERELTDQALLVLMFRRLRKSRYSYRPHDALEFTDPADFGLGEIVPDTPKSDPDPDSNSDSDSESESESDSDSDAASDSEVPAGMNRLKRRAAAGARAAIAAGVKRKQSTGNDERKQDNKKSKPNTQKK